jgi:type I restriction enzyme S subunit
MKDTQKLIPKRRFQKFIDDGTWEQRELGDEAIEIVAGGDIDKSKIRDKGKYPVLANALTNDGIIGYYESEYRIKSPAVTVTGRGDVGHAQARKIDFTPVVRLLSVSSNHDVDFLENAINTLEIMVESTGVPQLTVPQLAKYELFFPTSKHEEIAIGSFFTRASNLITLHQRKLEKIKNLKSAYLSKMFPKEGEKYPELRLAGFTDAWEQRKLGDMGDTFTGLSGKTKEDFGKGEAEFITYLNVFNNPISNIKLTERVELDKKQNEVRYGDIFFTTSSETPGEVGMSSVWLDNRENVYLNSFCFGYRLKDKVDPFYMAYSLRSNPIRNQFILLAQGISRYNISKTKAMDIEIMLPKLDEQIKLGKFFKQLDNLITLHQRKLEKLNGIKQAYLNEMFV